MIKKLSEFKDEKAICVVADLIEPIFGIIQNSENAKHKDDDNALKMFSAFFKNSPAEMLKVFAILSEEDPEKYHCDGVDVALNLTTLASDDKVLQLFTSQAQTGDAKSSAPALENTKE